MTLMFRSWAVVVAAAAALFTLPAVKGGGLLINGVASPCEPGTFSPTGRTPCIPVSNSS